MRYLHVIPHGGLANRLRALASAMWVADALGMHLVLTWPKDHMTSLPVGVLLDDVFDLDGRRLAALPTTRFSDAMAIDVAPAADGGEDTVTEVRSCVPFSHSPAAPAFSRAFWTAIRPYLRRLTPVEEVRRLVERRSSGFDGRTLGVHVRSGAGPAHFDLAGRITLELFFSEIDRLLEDAPDTRIFLCCDAAFVAERFAQRYGGIVATTHADAPGVAIGTFATAAGVRLALADLLLLSRTARILGSFYSSFSELAGVIGATPVKRLGGPGEIGGETEFTLFVEP